MWHLLHNYSFVHPSPLVAQLRDAEFCSYINHYISYSGFTPLHYAILLDDIEVVRLLLDNGANPTLENSRGCIPLDYCTNDDIMLLLEQYTIKVSNRHTIYYY